MSASFLFNFDLASLRRTLEAFIEVPNLVAVQVWDETDEPVFATWKSPETNTGERLPGDLELDEGLSGSSDSILKGEKVGSLRVDDTESPRRRKRPAWSPGRRCRMPTTPLPG